MRTVVYKCDRCGREDTDNKIDLADVSIAINGNSYIMRSFTDGNILLKQDWCARCRVEMGLSKPNMLNEKERSEVVPLSATLEDLIRELAREEAVNIYKELT